MHYLTGWFLRNPVAANLLMGLILFLGIMTSLSIRIEGFPRVPPDSALIVTYYPNATAAQVDDLVTQKLERALEGLEGVRAITSRSENGESTLTVRRAGGQSMDTLLDKIRLRIDGIDDLPAAAERPTIHTTGFDFPALYVNLHGDTDSATLQTLSERLREELLAEPELSRLNVWGLHKREMRIEILPHVLQPLNLTIADVVQQIQSSSLDFQAGTLRTAGGTVYLRTDSRARFASEFARIPIIENADGSTVLLSDLATIHDTLEEGDYLFRFNGSPTTGMEILVGHKENLLRISRVVHTVAERFERQLPANVNMTIWGDSSAYISERLSLLRTNGLQGLLLVTLLLSIFLNVRLAFWVAMGIPVSIMGAMAVAGSPWVDYSLNDVTTFGLIIALGILVDDAVVVGESVFEQRRLHPDPITGTERGVAKVSVATVFGVLTTIAAFYPMLLIDNPLGKVLAGFSGIVILALIFSLIESKFILPAHLASLTIDNDNTSTLSRYWGKLQAVAQNGLRRFRDGIYAPLLATALRNRYAVLITYIAAGVLGIGLIGLGKVKTVFFPDVPGQIISVHMEMDARAPFSLTKYNIEKIQAIGEDINREAHARAALDEPPIRAMFVIISSTTSAQIFAELTPVKDRPTVGIIDLAQSWRERTGQLEGTTELAFSGSEALGGGFQIKLLSKDADLLSSASDELQAFLTNIDGVHSVRDTLAGGQIELDIHIKPQARSLGFSTEALASQIGYAFGGAEAQRLQRNGEELRVIVSNAREARNTLDDLLQSQLRSANGDWIPFASVADVTRHYKSGALYRENGKTVNVISASIERSRVAPEEVSQAVFEQLEPELAQRYPSVQLKVAGELEEMGEIRGGMVRALLLAAVLIYVLMAVPLKSYWQPFVILAIVPFGFIGAAMGHLIMAIPLSLLSFFGMLALTGVVINDSLVMITRYNQARSDGATVSDALQDAGVGRFQAIFLTTATTVIGLMPLLAETSEQAQYLIPAAVSLAFGELFSTALMLILVPVLIAIVEDIKAWLSGA